MKEIQTIFRNEDMAPQNLKDWVEEHKAELREYPNHYLLILLPKGIVAMGETREKLLLQLVEMSQHMEKFSVEELEQPSFIVSTLVINQKNWGMA